jgi:hypothetical protein
VKDENQMTLAFTVPTLMETGKKQVLLLHMHPLNHQPSTLNAFPPTVDQYSLLCLSDIIQEADEHQRNLMNMTARSLMSMTGRLPGGV